VAQIVDYAASLTALSPEEIGPLFGAHDDTQRTWVDKVRGLFPDAHDPEELANVLLARLRTGEINIFVACDKAPYGLQEMLRGISSQAALHDFSLDLVEIEPHVRAGESGIIFVPRPRLTTEVVGRILVTVTDEHGDPKPGVAVKTDTVDKIEQNLKDAQEGGGRRNLSEEELKAHAAEHQVLPLYEQVLSTLRPLFDGANRTKSSLSLVGIIDGSRGVRIGVYPDASSFDRGIAMMVYEDLAKYFRMPEEELKQFLGAPPGDADTWWPERTWFFTETRLADFVRFLSKERQK
jgi:hypothetical protein